VIVADEGAHGFQIRAIGIVVPGARGKKGYVNAIIFKQTDVDAALSNITPNIINN